MSHVRVYGCATATDGGHNLQRTVGSVGLDTVLDIIGHIAVGSTVSCILTLAANFAAPICKGSGSSAALELCESRQCPWIWQARSEAVVLFHLLP